jgi:tetratricopeptide (TPR) repeat protein
MGQPDYPKLLIKIGVGELFLDPCPYLVLSSQPLAQPISNVAIHALIGFAHRTEPKILARSLRKYGDFLRNRGHLNFAKDVLLEALRLSGHGRGTRQRIYILGCLGDLERQRKNHAAASERFDRAIELARATFIPGWLGNLHLGLAELALDRNRFDEAKILLEQSEAHYRNTHPKHWWGEIQVGLSRCRLMRMSGSQESTELARTIRAQAIAAGYSQDATLASDLLKGRLLLRKVLMFL